MTDSMTPPSTTRGGEPDGQLRRTLLSRITRLEVVIGAAIAALMVLLVVIEPNILEAPFENGRTLLFTFGGTAVAAVVFVTMLWLRLPAPARVIVLVAPFAVVNWWLISPYFTDDVVDETFSTSISDQLVTSDDPRADPADPLAPADVDAATTPAAPQAEAPATTVVPAAEPSVEATPIAEAPVATDALSQTEAPPAPTGPVLLGAGTFVGLAGHDGTGDAGIFQNPDGSLVLRFENFDIENGPDLEVYFVPGADQVSLPDGSIHLGPLKGNIGDQNYELPSGTALAPGAYTALVWCEAFDVEFVGATLIV